MSIWLGFKTDFAGNKYNVPLKGLCHKILDNFVRPENLTCDFAKYPQTLCVGAIVVYANTGGNFVLLLYVNAERNQTIHFNTRSGYSSLLKSGTGIVFWAKKGYQILRHFSFSNIILSDPCIFWPYTVNCRDNWLVCLADGRYPFPVVIHNSKIVSALSFTALKSIHICIVYNVDMDSTMPFYLRWFFLESSYLTKFETMLKNSCA